MVAACAMPWLVSSLAGTSVGRVPTGLSQRAVGLEIKFGKRVRCVFNRKDGSVRAEVSNVSTQTRNAISLDGQAGELSSAAESSTKSFIWADSKRPRICILGGGFGGLYTALRLESLTWAPEKRPQVLLIDRSDRFVFKPLLYEILSKEVDQWEIAPTFSELLADTRVQFVKDSVTSVSSLGRSSSANASMSSGGSVLLDGGVEVEYDWLVLALGAESKVGGIPGVQEFAIPFVTLEHALEVDRRLLALERERFGMEGAPIDVVIVGSGYSGIELAATISERLGKGGKVKVVDPHTEICASSPVGSQQAALKVLSSRDVQVEGGFYVTSISESTISGTAGEGNGSVSAHTGLRKLVVSLKSASQRQSRMSKDSSQLTADLVIWTVGTKATVPAGPDAEYAAFPVNGRGQADTDETLRVTGHPRIFALGDSAGAKDSSGRMLPTTAQVAFQQADYAGWNLWAAIIDQPLLPFRYQHLGEMMTLGMSDAAVSVGGVENLTLDGILGHTARKLLYLYRLPGDSHKVKVAGSWLAKSAISSMAFIQNEVLKAVTSR